MPTEKPRDVSLSSISDNPILSSGSSANERPASNLGSDVLRILLGSDASQHRGDLLNSPSVSRRSLKLVRSPSAASNVSSYFPDRPVEEDDIDDGQVSHVMNCRQRLMWSLRRLAVYLWAGFQHNKKWRALMLITYGTLEPSNILYLDYRMLEFFGKKIQFSVGYRGFYGALYALIGISFIERAIVHNNKQKVEAYFSGHYEQYRAKLLSFMHIFAIILRPIMSILTLIFGNSERIFELRDMTNDLNVRNISILCASIAAVFAIVLRISITYTDPRYLVRFFNRGVTKNDGVSQDVVKNMIDKRRKRIMPTPAYKKTFFEAPLRVFFAIILAVKFGNAAEQVRWTVENIAPNLGSNSWRIGILLSGIGLCFPLTYQVEYSRGKWLQIQYIISTFFDFVFSLLMLLLADAGKQAFDAKQLLRKDIDGYSRIKYKPHFFIVIPLGLLITLSCAYRYFLYKTTDESIIEHEEKRSVPPILPLAQRHRSKSGDGSSSKSEHDSVPLQQKDSVLSTTVTIHPGDQEPQSAENISRGYTVAGSITALSSVVSSPQGDDGLMVQPSGEKVGSAPRLVAAT